MSDPVHIRRTTFRLDTSAGSEQAASIYRAVKATTFSTTNVTALSISGRGSLMYLRGASAGAGGYVTVAVNGSNVVVDSPASGANGKVYVGRGGKTTEWVVDPNTGFFVPVFRYWGSPHARGLVFTSSLQVLFKSSSSSWAFDLFYDYQLYE